MKKLSQFKDEQAVMVVADLLAPIMEILTNPKNEELKDAQPYDMFSGFFKNSPKAMMKVFAILEEKDIKEYHCNGVDVIKNIMELVTDEELTSLFTSAK